MWGPVHQERAGGKEEPEEVPHHSDPHTPAPPRSTSYFLFVSPSFIGSNCHTTLGTLKVSILPTSE